MAAAAQASLVSQAEARVHRRGVAGCVNVYFLVGRGTGDETRWRALSRKVGMCRAVHGAALPGRAVDVASVSENDTVLGLPVVGYLPMI